MAKQNIETILERVRAVEARDADAGLSIRRVVERAEDNWNARPETDNAQSIVVKTLDADDLRAAAEQIGLVGNKNVVTFIKLIGEMAAPKVVEPTDEERQAAEQRVADEVAAAQAADDLMSGAFADVDDK